MAGTAFWGVEFILAYRVGTLTKEREIEFTSVAAVASFYNLYSSFSSCWHHTGPLAQIVLLPHGACNL